MSRAKHRRPSPPRSPPPARPPPKFKLRMMSCRRKPPKPKKRPPPWRKPESVEICEEICDLERDIAIHSESPPSGAIDGQCQAHDEKLMTRECDKAGPGKPTTSWTRKRRPAASKKNVPWMKRHTVVDLSHEICDLERDILFHPDFPANTSTRDARALSRAAGRIARAEASQFREGRKPKKLARKQQQRYREGQRQASKMAPPQKPARPSPSRVLSDVDGDDTVCLLFIWVTALKIDAHTGYESRTDRPGFRSCCDSENGPPEAA